MKKENENPLFRKKRNIDKTTMHKKQNRTH